MKGEQTGSVERVTDWQEQKMTHNRLC